MQITKLKFPTYHSSLWIVIDKTLYSAFDKIEDITNERIVNPKEIRSIRAYTFAYEKESGGYRVILFFKQTVKPGEIAHEAKHAINVIFAWHGARLSLTNDEAECYTLEWIVDRCHDAIKKYKKINKKLAD